MARLRGQEAKIQVLVDGKLQKGSFATVENYKITPRIDFADGDFVGEDASEPDYQHHGFEFSFTVNETDSTCQALLQDITDRLAAGQAPPKINIVVRKNYRDGGSTPARVEVLERCLLKLDDEGGSRKEYIKFNWSGRCRRKRVLPSST